MSAIPGMGERNLIRSGNWRQKLASDNESASTSQTNKKDDASSDGYESDWERNVSEEGDVFFVVPLSEAEAALQSSSSAQPSSSATANERPGSKKSGKLSRLVRRRESKRERNVPSQSVVPQTSHKSNSQPESSDTESSTYYGQLKTFESVFEGANPVEMLEVNLRIKGKKNVDPRRSLMEQMMGIIPVRPGSESQHHLTNVIISGYLTDGPAIKISDKLQIGDIIRLVDGQQVNLATIEQLLSTHASSAKVKLTIQRSAKLFQPDGSSHDESTSSSSVNGQPKSQLQDPFQATSGAKTQNLLKRLPYLILYLTRSGITESSPDMADVLYQYPSAASGQHSAKLLKTRGMITTLSQVLSEVTGFKPSLVSLLVEGQLVHVGMVEEKEDLFVMALPDIKRSSKEVAQIVRDTVRVLRFNFRTLSNAFSSYRRQHPLDLNEFFTNILVEELIGSSKSGTESWPNIDVSTILAPSSAKFESGLQCCQWLNLPDEVRFQIDDAISQFESGDFQDYSEDFYDLPREFNILGSCLFHKGYLLCSHLNREDLLDVVLWCKNRKLFSFTRENKLQQLVSWAEVYLIRESGQNRYQIML